MSKYDELVVLIKKELSLTENGKVLLSRWSDAKIKMELKDPCFFGAKPEMRDRVKAVQHFKRIANVNSNTQRPNRA